MRMHDMRRWPRVPAILAFVGMLLGGASGAVEAALTTKSPEVLKAIDRGIEYLVSNGTSDSRLGAYALAGMSLLTYGESIDHPMVAECAAKIQEELKKKEHNPQELNDPPFDIYSTGLSIIFLVDRAPDKHRADIECLLAYLRKMQKPHGGWGYPNLETGDTSMTQYGVLSSWKAIHAGFNVPIDSIERVTLWLVRTQDPSGGYGYQGKIGEDNKLVKQIDVKQGLTAAGLGSLYICSDMLGMTKKVERRDDDVPHALKEVKPKENEPGAPKVKTSIDSQLVHATEGRGNQWFAQHFKVDAGQYNHYYLYAFERYMSFREYCDKINDKDPKWYSDIAAHLLEKQAEDGSWKGECGVVPDTSFAVLFLLRSMRKSLEKAKNFGEGIMVGGRGLPKDTSKAMLDADGKVVSRPLLGPAERLLAALADPELANIDDSVNLVEELPADKLDTLMAKHGDVLRRLVGNKSPKARWAIVKALGKTRNLDNVEVLIYALTDPIPEVVHAANEALSRIRRNLDAVALPEKFTEEDRRLVIEKWKTWYRSIRPDAKFEWTESK
ncbi:MAG: HEAT repeat domain-containing protein [Planctomycetes bacterium]|nr:HEAT repeat domain-containing protein [Planctomycetota bacterium]MCG2682495.1 HEAT repeat domain-containing protein [Planctomycetales bacterium]